MAKPEENKFTIDDLAYMLDSIWNGLRRINRRLKIIMATQAELADKLNKIGDGLDKALAEITAAIQALKDALATAGTTTPEVDAAVARLDTVKTTLDDLNPDITPTP